MDPEDTPDVGSAPGYMEYAPLGDVDYGDIWIPADSGSVTHDDTGSTGGDDSGG
jgi:hypothetical protein